MISERCWPAWMVRQDVRVSYPRSLFIHDFVRPEDDFSVGKQASSTTVGLFLLSLFGDFHRSVVRFAQILENLAILTSNPLEDIISPNGWIQKAVPLGRYPISPFRR